MTPELENLDTSRLGIKCKLIDHKLGTKRWVPMLRSYWLLWITMEILLYRSELYKIIIWTQDGYNHIYNPITSL